MYRDFEAFRGLVAWLGHKAGRGTLRQHCPQMTRRPGIRWCLASWKYLIWMLFPDVAVPGVAILEDTRAVKALLRTDLRFHLCMPMWIFSLFSPRSSSDNKSLPIQIPRSSMPDTFIDLLTHSILTLALATLWLFFKFDTNIREVDFLLKQLSREVSFAITSTSTRRRRGFRRRTCTWGSWARRRPRSRSPRPPPRARTVRTYMKKYCYFRSASTV